MRFSVPQSAQVRLAVTVAALTMTWQVAAKTARDSLFLAVFPAESLLTAVGAAAVCSILLSYASSVALRRAGPARLMPAAFFLNATVHVMQWILLPVWRAPVTAFIYVHVVAFGPVLLTGFWALVNECFDAREARRQFGRIAAFGTIGAVAGGLLAERVAALSSAPEILLLLAGLQVLAGAGMLRFAALAPSAGSDEPASFPEMISSAPYLAGLAAVVLLTSMSAASLDYLYRAGAVARFGRGQGLVRFFSLFNAGAAGLTFVLQSALSAVWLRRFGPGRTVAALPVAVAGASLASAVWPGAASVMVARGLEQMLRGSLFRAGYELFFLPMPPGEKRAAKPILDSGVDRLGEGLASGAIKLLLLTLPGQRFATVLLVSAAAASGLAAWIALRLDQWYVGLLERGLALQNVTAATVEETIAATYLLESDSGMFTTAEAVRAETAVQDPVLARLGRLRHPDGMRVREAIAEVGAWEPVIVAQMIDLLGREDVARQAGEALRANLAVSARAMAERLADGSADMQIRRRIPRLLGASTQPRVWETLVQQVEQDEFEIRYRCGRALVKIAERQPEFRPAADRVFRAVQRELASYGIAGAQGEAARQRLAHMANLLSLVLPAQSVALAFRALQTQDPKLRATAIEYLDSVLPHGLRRQMAAQFEVPLPATDQERRAEDVLHTLVAELGSDLRAPEGGEE